MYVGKSVLTWWPAPRSRIATACWGATTQTNLQSAIFFDNILCFISGKCIPNKPPSQVYRPKILREPVPSPHPQAFPNPYWYKNLQLIYRRRFQCSELLSLETNFSPDCTGACPYFYQIRVLHRSYNSAGHRPARIPDQPIFIFFSLMSNPLYVCVRSRQESGILAMSKFPTPPPHYLIGFNYFGQLCNAPEITLNKFGQLVIPPSSIHLRKFNKKF